MKNLILSFMHSMVLLTIANIFAFPAYAGAQDKLKLRQCGGLEQKVIDSFELFRWKARNNRNALIGCMRLAYLVEHNKAGPTKIVNLLTKGKVTKIKCRNLTGKNASAHRVYIKRGVMKMDRDFIRESTTIRIASVIAHETMHNNGLNHRKNDFGSLYFENTVPEQIESCFLSGRPNSKRGPGKDRYVPKDIVGFAIDDDTNWIFGFSKDGTVAAGTSDRIHIRRVPYRYTLPRGYSPSDIVGMAMDGDKNWTFTWTKQGFAMAGTTDDLDKFRKPYRYTLPRGYSPSDIVGMALDGDKNNILTWTRNGKAMVGTSDDLDKRRKPYKVTTGR